MRDKYIVALFCLIGLGIGFYVWTQLEYYEEEVDVGWSLSAYINPYLAAEQFLEEIDLEVEGDFQLDPSKSLSVDSTIFISNSNYVLDKRRADSLVEWMERGGHVIIAAQVLSENENDVFLDRFDVEKYSYQTNAGVFSDDETGDNEEEPSLSDRIREAGKVVAEEDKKRIDRKQAEKEGRLNTLADKLVYEENQFDSNDMMTLTFAGVEGDFDILLAGEEYLDHPSLYMGEDETYEGYAPFYWESNDAGIGFMQFYVGEGLLTVVADGNIWNNENIGLFDHAYLLQLLTKNSGKVIFLRWAVVPSLFELLWTHYFEMCVVMTLILVLWLVYRGRRFGPVVDTSDRGRRSYREHLSAVGDFYWRYKNRDQLLKNARDAVWKEFNKKVFSARSLFADKGADKNGEAARLGHLAAMTEKNLDYVRILMTGETPQDEYKFYQLIKSLQKIRKQL